MQTEFGIHYILESFDRLTLDFHDIISILQIVWGCILHCSVYVWMGRWDHFTMGFKIAYSKNRLRNNDSYKVGQNNVIVHGPYFKLTNIMA